MPCSPGCSDTVGSRPGFCPSHPPPCVPLPGAGAMVRVMPSGLQGPLRPPTHSPRQKATTHWPGLSGLKTPQNSASCSECPQQLALRPSLRGSSSWALLGEGLGGRAVSSYLQLGLQAPSWR